MNPDEISAVNDGRPIVFRNATVLTMDGAGIIAGGDVLVVGDSIAGVGPALIAPEGAIEIDAAGGILMPGMVDTHRHMWQTALRGLGADWTLTQYFVFYYLSWGKIFRPEDIHAGNLLSAIEAVDAGVTTTLDWSHGLQTIDHGEAAADALLAAPGRFVLAYGNLLGAPWEWANSPEFRAFVDRRRSTAHEKLGLRLAFDVTGDPAFPERGAFEAARELGLAVTTHAGVWGATNDDSIRLMWENGFMTPEVNYVHASTLTDDSYQRIAATGGSASVSTESEQSAGQGYPPTWHLRKHGIPVSLSMDTSVWWSADLFSAMRATLSADRSREHLEAHARGETVVHNLDEREANKISELLAESEISATKGVVDNGRTVSYTISVPAKSKVDAIRLLNRNEMPRRPDMGYTEVFKDSGLIPTAAEEHAKQMAAVEGEIEKQLKLGLDLKGGVHLVLRRSCHGRTVGPPSARGPNSARP